MPSKTTHKTTIGDLKPGFLEYLSTEKQCASSTIARYEYNIRCFMRDVGNVPITDVRLHHFFSLKSRMGKRGAREARTGSVVAAVKSLLMFARDIHKIPVLELSVVKSPKPPRRDVIYLTESELAQFLEAIPLRTWDGGPRLVGYRFRALCEIIVGSGMRLGETLALNKDSIDFEHRQAVIVGKGNKQRTVFFTKWSLQWLTRYLDLRRDRGQALFATEVGERLKPHGVQAMFKRIMRLSELQKPVTAHILRHTTGTLLLKKGCPIGYIKEILGHDRLETTCRYYLGILNKADAQKAHRAYMDHGEGDKPIYHEDPVPQPFPKDAREFFPPDTPSPHSPVQGNV